jgi:hypothetical protein
MAAPSWPKLDSEGRVRLAIRLFGTVAQPVEQVQRLVAIGAELLLAIGYPLPQLLCSLWTLAPTPCSARHVNEIGEVLPDEVEPIGGLDSSAEVAPSNPDHVGARRQRRQECSDGEEVCTSTVQ